MTRPHEDIQHHTAVDHRPGGPPVQFAKNAWCAIDVVHVKSDRVDAGISAYETLIEEARKSAAKAGSAAILRADHMTLAFVQVGGHDAFKHLQSAWDDHHLVAEHRAVAESSKLALYQVIAVTGDCALDPQSKNVYAFERIPTGPAHVAQLVATLVSTPGFLGALLLATDDAMESIVVYRFEHAAQIEGLRPLARLVHPVKTFA